MNTIIKQKVIIFSQGNHFIGIVEKETDHFIVLKDCCRVAILPIEGKMSINMLPLSYRSPFVKQATFVKDLIITMEEASDIYDQLIMQKSNLIRPNPQDIEMATRAKMSN